MRRVPNIYDRVVSVLKGKSPDRLPFCTRLTIWHTGLKRTGRLPNPYNEMSLNEIHAHVRVGHQHYFTIHEVRLRGVELIAKLNGERYFHEQDPVVGSFPRMHSLVDFETPGITDIELITPKGTLTIRHELLRNMVDDGLHSYLTVRPIKDASDYPAFEYIIENCEYLYLFDEYRALQDQIGGVGYVLAFTERIPFQNLLLDCVGEVPLFYMMYDEPQLFQQLLKLLHEKLIQVLKGLADFKPDVVEFSDNLEAQMTNPNLFKEYCLPHYQRYADLMHGHDIKISSHTDGDLKSLLGLLAETGLDVCESISPTPLTFYTFDEVWNAWENGPIIWGGIPAPILEARTPEAEFRTYVERILETISEPRIILGVGDMVLPINAVDRVRYIAERVEEHAFN